MRNQQERTHGVASVETWTDGTDLSWHPWALGPSPSVGEHTRVLTCTSSHIVRQLVKPRVLPTAGVDRRPLAGASRDLEHRHVANRCEKGLGENIFTSSRRLATFRYNSLVPHDDFTGVSCSHSAEHY
jgi:hypothetical protein